MTQPLKLWHVLSILTIVVVTMAAVFGPLHACACGGPGTGCLSNLKQQGRAMHLYMSTWDERLPHRDRWMDVTQTYSETTKRPAKNQIFVDPEIKGKGQYGYAFDSRLSLQREDKFPDPKQQTMAYDSVNRGRNASDPHTSLPPEGRHSGRNNQVFLDGHAKGYSVKTGK